MKPDLDVFFGSFSPYSILPQRTPSERSRTDPQVCLSVTDGLVVTVVERLLCGDTLRSDPVVTSPLPVPRYRPSVQVYRLFMLI